MADTNESRHLPMATPSLHPGGPKAYEQPPLFGIDFVPARVRRHGLREAHTYPLVSPGKKLDGSMSLFRVPAAQAWRRRRAYHHIELNPPFSWSILAFDVDRHHAHEWLVDLWDDGRIPELNWSVERVVTTHAQAVLTLLRPVLRGEGAREKPQNDLARISEYLAQTMKADRGYTGLTAFNPVAATRQLKTRWGRPQPYSLAELRRFIPKDWRMPPPPALITIVGRNQWLFKNGTRWRWREENRNFETLDYLVAQNAILDPPLGFNEIKGIAKSIQKFWERNGGVHTKQWRAKQRRRARRRAQLEREKNAPRDQEIHLFNYAGWSVREITNELRNRGYEIGKSTVHDVLVGNEALQLSFDMLDDVPVPPSLAQQLELEQRRRRIFDLRAQGLTRPEIAIKEGVSRATVDRALRE